MALPKGTARGPGSAQTRVHKLASASKLKAYTYDEEGVLLERELEVGQWTMTKRDQRRCWVCNAPILWGTSDTACKVSCRNVLYAESYRLAKHKEEVYRKGRAYDLTLEAWAVRILFAQFKGLLKKAGLPDIRFYDLRHSSATMLLSIGVHPKVVQELPGHSQISMTMDIYSHVLPTMQQEAIGKLNIVLEG